MSLSATKVRNIICMSCWLKILIKFDFRPNCGLSCWWWKDHALFSPDWRMYRPDIIIHNKGKKYSAFLCNDQNIPINSLAFSKSNESLAAGFADGYLKVWDLKKKEARVFKPSKNFSVSQAVTSVSLTNELMAASTNQGHINFFPMSQTFNSAGAS